MQDTIVVTGGAGFLGQHIAARVRATGRRVVVIDRVPSPSGDGVMGDVRDREFLAEHVAGAAAIIHAAYAPPQAAGGVIGDVNIVGTEALCDVASTERIERVVLVSSTIVEKPPRRHPISGAAPLSRLDDYRASRVRAEEIAQDRLGNRLTIVRPRTFVGPGRVGGFALVYDAVKNGGVVPLLGPGTNVIQLVDVRDLASLIVTAASAGTGGVVHAGSADPTSIRATFEALIEHAGSDAVVRSLPSPVGRLAARTVELAGLSPLAEWHHATAAGRDVTVDNAAALALGWTPTHSDVDALIESYDWFVANQLAERVTTHPVTKGHRFLAAAARRLLR